MVRVNNDDIKTMKQRKNLLIAKSLFFSTSMSNVGWSRFQNNFYLDQGLSSTEIGNYFIISLLPPLSPPPPPPLLLLLLLLLPLLLLL